MGLQHWTYIIALRLRSLLRRGQVEAELDEELRYHLERQIEENLAAGMTAEEARYAALRAMGGIEQQKERCRDMRRVNFIEDLIQDVRFGLRSIFRNPGFTAIAVLTLALGIGANTAIFSVVNQLLLRPLPFPNADRLVMLWEVTPEGRHQNTTSRGNFRNWLEQSTSFESMAAFSDQRLSLTGNGEPEEVSVQLATVDLFRVLGVAPILGRDMTEEDVRRGSPNIVILGYGIWQRRYGGDPEIVGKPITLNGVSCTVVGVLPANFQWHIRKRSGTGKPAEIWTPLPLPTEGPGTVGRFLSAVARLKPGVSIEHAEAEMKTIQARLSDAEPQYNKDYTAEVISLREQLVGNVRLTILVLLGAVGLVLLIACANVANLMLSRAAAREKEIALRTALGAYRGRIVRQLLTESLLLALVSSLLGLGLAWWGIQALVAISPSELVNLQDVGINPAVLGWTLAISLLTGFIFGLAPALEATRLNLNDSLKEGKGTGGQGTRRRRLRSAIVVVEVALALVLLVSAGLLVKSFARLQKINTGFNTENVLTMVLRLPDGKYRQDPQVISFFRQATERIGALPGVRSVGIVNYLPLYGGLGSNTGFTIEGKPLPPPGQEPATNVRVSDSGYFDAMGIPLLHGRKFSEIENREAKHVVIISESLAQQHFPGEDPIGKRISVFMFNEPTPTEIIGVVGDVRYDSLTDEAQPTVYFPHPELTYSFMTLVIQTNGDPAAMVSAVRGELRELDPEQPVADVRTMNQVMADTVGRARFNTLLFGLFSALATILAAIGIFGVMNYSVTLRTREIGLRMALGAKPSGVLMLILRQGLLLTVIGIGIGLVGAFALTRVMSSLLFGVDATDPATFAAIVLLLALVSIIACYIPARRATKVDPMIALRFE